MTDKAANNYAEWFDTLRIPDAIRSKDVVAACRIMGLDPGQVTSIAIHPHWIDVQFGNRGEYADKFNALIQIEIPDPPIEGVTPIT